MEGAILQSPGAKKLIYTAAAGLAVVLLAIGVSYWAMAGAEVTGDTPQERIESITQLADKSSPKAAEAIAVTLQDSDAGVRRTAVIALTRIARAEDAPRVQASLKDPDATVRAAAAAGVGRVRPATEAVPALRAAISSDPSPEVRIEAAKGLCRARTSSAVVALFEAMQKDSDPAVRMIAFKMLLEVEAFSGYNAPPDSKDPAAWGKLCEQVRGWPKIARAMADVAKGAG